MLDHAVHGVVQGCRDVLARARPAEDPCSVRPELSRHDGVGAVDKPVDGVVELLWWDEGYGSNRRRILGRNAYLFQVGPWATKEAVDISLQLAALSELVQDIVEGSPVRWPARATPQASRTRLSRQSWNLRWRSPA